LFPHLSLEASIRYAYNPAFAFNYGRI